MFVINAMLIASATMLVVRLLRFPIVQNVDLATERKYKRRFSVMLFALLVPSVYILYTTVSTSLLSSKFHNFVEDNIEAPGMLVVEEVVDLTGAHPRIDVVVVGKQVSEGTIAKWQRQIEKISPNAKLSVFQNDVDNTGVEELRRMIDLYAQGQASLERKDGELDKLREEAVQLETKLSLALQRQFPESLPGELLSAFPEMGKLRLGFLGNAAQQEHAISFSETPFFEVTWVDTTHVEQREEKLSAFLKARLGRTDIEVVSNLGGSSVDRRTSPLDAVFMPFYNLILRCGIFMVPLMLLLSNAAAQTIVNTETLLLDGEEVFEWTAGAAGDFSAGNSEVVDLTLDGGCALAMGKWQFKAAAAWAKLAEDGQDIQSNASLARCASCGVIPQPFNHFFLFRHLKTTCFFMSKRNLWGAGVKRRLVNAPSTFLDVSLGAFSEHERYVDEALEVPHNMVRNSLIVSLGCDVTEEVMFRMTTFVQTSYEDLSDSRVFMECSLNAIITDKVSLEWSSGLRWDSQPHGGLGTWDLGNALGLRFGLNQDE